MKLPHAAHFEPQTGSSSAQLNWLRAAVLGANDGIVSLAALVVGVAGATETSGHIMLVGIAGLIAGALSMAVGEYVSVSSQRDTEESLLEKEKWELEEFPHEELEELTAIYQKRGLSRQTAEVVARELTSHDAFSAHARDELGIQPDELTSPWQAALASALSFFTGAMIPLLAIVLPPASIRIPVTFAAVLVALIITGALSAKMSGSRVVPVTMRVVIGGALAMIVTFGVGRLFGVANV